MGICESRDIDCVDMAINKVSTAQEVEVASASGGRWGRHVTGNLKGFLVKFDSFRPIGGTILLQMRTVERTRGLG
jgi:hypothetical protein